MMSTRKDEAMAAELDEVLYRAKPCSDSDLDTPEIDNALAALRRSIKTAPAPATSTLRRFAPGRKRRTRRIATMVAAAIAVPAIALATPAAAEWISLRTGTYDVSVGEPRTPDREMWRHNSPEAAEKLRAYAREYGLAPGYSIEPMVKRYASDNAEKLALGFRTSVLSWSLCTWTLTWVDADRDGNVATQRTAVTQIRRNADLEESLGLFPERVPAIRNLAVAAESGRASEVAAWDSEDCERVQR